ncbi:AtpZ/AtpI family protein [Flavobacteriaceae bacterium M23B6Z8]
MNNSEKPKNKLDNYAKLSGIAFQMIAIIGAGAFAGIKLDEKYPNKYSVYTIVLSLLSVFIALYLIIKQVSNLK